MRSHFLTSALLALALLCVGPVGADEEYESFDAAIYVRAYEVREMADLDWLRQRFDVMDEHLKVSKVYLETHRDKILVDEEILRKAKQFFAERGIATAGGITLTIDEGNRFETFSYSDPEHRAWVQKVIDHMVFRSAGILGNRRCRGWRSRPSTSSPLSPNRLRF